jgi:hypothetical protein
MTPLWGSVGRRLRLAAVFRWGMPQAYPDIARDLRGRVAVAGGALLVASLAAACGSNDRPGATATPPSTTIAVGNTNAATTVTASAAGQTVRGIGYSFSLPTAGAM